MLKQVAVLSLVVVATGYGAQPAEALDPKTECGGKLVNYVPVRTDQGNGPKIGQLELYYNAGNGNHCAIFYHGGPTWDKRLFTAVWMYPHPRRPSNTPFPGGYVDDGDYYRFQAGPVRVKSRCVFAAGNIKYQGVTYVGGFSTKPICS